MTDVASTPATTFRRQYGVRSLLLLTLAVALLLALGRWFPQAARFTGLMLPVLLAPLAILLLCSLALHIAAALITRQSIKAAIWRSLQLLWPDESVGVAKALVVAVGSSAILIAIWPAMRETAVEAAMRVGSNTGSAIRLTRTLSEIQFWKRLQIWEAWSLARWWVLFGSLAVVLSLFHTVAGCQANRRTSAILKRLLLFAPWIILLDPAFLVGVFIAEPDGIVPEPSTLFTVGVFSWDLWTWMVWTDGTWLTRGAAPTLIVGMAFFRRVIKYTRFVSICLAAALIPPALILSVAWTRLFIDLITG